MAQVKQWAAIALTLVLAALAGMRAFVTGPKKPGETLRTGLWRYSRHPNYLGEMLVWWSLWLFGFAADPVWGQWAIAAPLAISAMFLFVSIPLIEKRSLERRANYQQVIDETSMVDLPLMARLLDALRPDASLLLVGDHI